ncbi:MAG: ketoacyl-ACP synthase III [Bacteroidales bacterium]|nr:ketoacyl-ACP synthase III [Bacteroidales bacterium]MBN2699773.1 ketoacyl-ACP synthase III [Bacteroidales bacterium]
MKKYSAGITAVHGWVPEYRLTNEELSTMVDTTDEWIMQRIGIKERRILKEEGKATSDMGAEAVRGLLEKRGIKPEEVDLLICATITADMHFPSTANLISDKAGMKNAWSFDISAACSGFLFALQTASQFIETGRHQKVVVVGADMMSSITDYTDRTTCPLFGDAAAAVLLEPVGEGEGIIDSILEVDGSGVKHLHMKAGGSLRPPSHETVDAREHFVFQEGQAVFKVAVSKMADVSIEIMKKNKVSRNDLNWLVPHQANMRIIEAVARRMGIPREKVMINLEKYGNTTAATIPLCLWEWEPRLRKGDKLVLSAFGGGFTWGSIYIIWAYDRDK